METISEKELFRFIDKWDNDRHQTAKQILKWYGDRVPFAISDALEGALLEIERLHKLLKS